MNALVLKTGFKNFKLFYLFCKNQTKVEHSRLVALFNEGGYTENQNLLRFYFLFCLWKSGKKSFINICNVLVLLRILL